MRYGEKHLDHFHFNTQSFLYVVIGEQKLLFFFIVCRWSSASLDEFVVVYCWVNCVSISYCIRSFMCPRSATGKGADRFYRQFSFPVSDFNARIWLSSRSVVCGLFELYLTWEKCWKIMICMFNSNANNAVQRNPIFFQRMPLLKSIGRYHSKSSFFFSKF